VKSHSNIDQSLCQWSGHRLLSISIL